MLWKYSVSAGWGSCQDVNESDRTEMEELGDAVFFVYFWFYRNTDVKMPSHHNNDFMLMWISADT